MVFINWSNFTKSKICSIWRKLSMPMNIMIIIVIGINFKNSFFKKILKFVTLFFISIIMIKMIILIWFLNLAILSPLSLKMRISFGDLLMIFWMLFFILIRWNITTLFLENDTPLIITNRILLSFWIHFASILTLETLFSIILMIIVLRGKSCNFKLKMLTEMSKNLESCYWLLLEILKSWRSIEIQSW